MNNLDAGISIAADAAAAIAVSARSHADGNEHCHTSAYKAECSGCQLSKICLPIALNTADIDRLDAIIQRGRPLRKGAFVYRQGEPFTAVYAVRSGTLKAYHYSDGGEETVTGFYLPGEIFGMDGLSQNVHVSTAIALETATVCEIPFARLGELSAQIPSLQRHFFQLLSREIATDQELLASLAKHTAEQRIAALLLSIAARNARRKLSATAFRLPMSRTDIGNYLGLTVETVSRIFGRLQSHGLMSSNHREIKLLRPEWLREVANGASLAPPQAAAC